MRRAELAGESGPRLTTSDANTRKDWAREPASQAVPLHHSDPRYEMHLP